MKIHKDTTSEALPNTTSEALPNTASCTGEWQKRRYEFTQMAGKRRNVIYDLRVLVKYHALSPFTDYIIANFFDWSIMCNNPNN